jgi:hypothetical protein
MIRFRKDHRENDHPLSITGYSQSGLSIKIRFLYRQTEIRCQYEYLGFAKVGEGLLLQAFEKRLSTALPMNKITKKHLTEVTVLVNSETKVLFFIETANDQPDSSMAFQKKRWDRIC